MINKKLKIPCEIYSRVSGYYRPVKNFNIGKQQEFSERKFLNVGNEKYNGDDNGKFKA